MQTVAVEGLEVRGASGGPCMKIASCYVRGTIPCRREIIPTADIIREWPHLSHIKIPQYYENAPIGLLIGYHCTQVMRPLEIATGGDDEPIGWKTSLGWCIVGGLLVRGVWVRLMSLAVCTLCKAALLLGLNIVR